MDLITHLGIGFEAALSLNNLGFCLAGALLGTLVGVLPGVGPLATIAILLPVTFGMPALPALIMLAGIYYGSQYGGSTTAILLKLPGESSSVVTCLEGYEMAQQGRAGTALAIAAIGSFIAGSIATVAIALFAPILAWVAQKFGAPEYFALMVLGLCSAVVLAHGSLVKAVALTFTGLLFGLIGTDVSTGIPRFTFGFRELSNGIEFVPLALGLFGLSEIIVNLERPQARRVINDRITGLWIRWTDFKASFPAIMRGTTLGTLLGILPGGGAILSSFASYMLEKKIAKDPSRFGKGAIEGVAGPEAANNAGAQTSFIPLLTLGIPSNAVMALFMGALIMQGIQPGPMVMTEQPVLFWGVIASMWIGNLMLLVINLPLIGIWVSLLRVPYRILFPCILIFACMGVYSINNSSFDVMLTVLFGLLGYIFIKLDCEPAPLLLGFILGPLMEENLRRAMVLSHGDATVFLQRPISLGILICVVAMLALVIVPAIRQGREEAFKE